MWSKFVTAGTVMTEDQIAQLFGEMKFDYYNEPIVFGLSYEMGAWRAGQFAYKEFETGMAKLEVTSIDELHAKCNELNEKLKDVDQDYFEKVYTFTFDLVADGS